MTSPLTTPRLYRTEAVVLRRHDLGEADRILTLYTAHWGKIRAVAKGVRRPTSKLGGHVELFTHSKVMLAHGRNLDVLTQSETIDSFIGLREDLWRASQAYCVGELLDRLTEDREENHALYELLVATLDRIATTRDPELATRFFEVQLLGLLGYRPELKECLRCRRLLEPAGNAFSFAGGVLCPECKGTDATARPLSTSAFKVLRLCQTGDWSSVSRLKVDQPLHRELQQVIQAYAQVVAESQLKSAGFVGVLRHAGVTAD